MFDNDDEDLIRRLRAGAGSPVERCMTTPSFPEAVIAQAQEGVQRQVRCDVERAIRFADERRVPLEPGFGYCGHPSRQGAIGSATGAGRRRMS